MIIKRVLQQAWVCLALCALPAMAATIFDSGPWSLGVSDPKQLGRISRSGVISDWSAIKAFPGVINPAVSYYYHAFDIAVPVGFSYLQISVDDISGAGLIFASAYLGRYAPASTGVNLGLDTNYMGDEGGSGNIAGADPRAFQVRHFVPGDLVVVVNDSNPTNGGLGKPFDILVEGFTDTAFNDTLPEPVTFLLTASGLLGCAILRRAAR